MNKKIVFILAFVFTLMIGCEDVLERPQLNQLIDEKANWEKEDFVRNFSVGFYKEFFPGYNDGWALPYAPLRGCTFSDDCSSQGKQALFENTVPSSRGSSARENTPPLWLSSYGGPTWYFGWVRRANLMLNRVELNSKEALSDEAYNHWTGIARFFRGYEYARLVSTFGDVPYYDKVMSEDQLDELFKDRDDRNSVMDKVYDDFKFALAHVRLVDADQTVNRDVVAGIISRWMLFEGTWQKYHLNDGERAKKFLSFAEEAADIIIKSNKYAIEVDFRTLFGSNSLAGVKDCIFYRHYDAAQGVTHPIAGYSSGNEIQSSAINLALVKSFICNDGKVWQNSGVEHASSFSLDHLITTRDPRFEASFWTKPKEKSSSLLLCWKFVDRIGPTFEGKTAPPQYTSYTNANDYPVIRYAEILLNWIEAKGELATLGGNAVAQSDIDISVNAIRNRPLDGEAEMRGVKKTAPMQLTELPDDPARDADVEPLLWEIRRERRMEFLFEHARLPDIRRWKKLDYMDAEKNPDLLKSIWVDFPKEMKAFLEKKREGKLTVYKENGEKVVYDGTNGDEMVGFYHIYTAINRDAFSDRAYLSPVGKAQVDEYQAKGYKLSQTKGWE